MLLTAIVVQVGRAVGAVAGRHVLKVRLDVLSLVLAPVRVARPLARYSGHARGGEVIEPRNVAAASRHLSTTRLPERRQLASAVSRYLSGLTDVMVA